MVAVDQGTRRALTPFERDKALAPRIQMRLELYKDSTLSGVSEEQRELMVYVSTVQYLRNTTFDALVPEYHPSSAKIVAHKEFLHTDVVARVRYTTGKHREIKMQIVEYLHGTEFAYEPRDFDADSAKYTQSFKPSKYRLLSKSTNR